MKPEVLLVDNKDSFSFNLVEAFERIGARVRVYRNDVPADELARIARALTPRPLVVLSPGPGKPGDAGNSPALVELVRGHLPVLGVCLGHQILLELAGARVERADVVVHGRASRIEHDGAGPFAGLPSPLSVGRYHSLCVRDVPERFRIHAELDGMAMAVTDDDALQTGLQFHPESILTPSGDCLLRNVLENTRAA